MNLLDINDDCMLEIMKYIISDCELREESPDDPSKYADMENFAKVDENIKELLRIHHKDIFYHRELTKVATKSVLTLDFSQLQTAIANQNEGEAYWKLYTKAIERNNSIENANLFYNPTCDYPEFPNHFQMIRCALENKRELSFLKLALNGYSLNDLNNFGNLTHLNLDVRISAEALVSVCQSYPRLRTLEFMSTDFNGRLSDIVLHCRDLEFLTFVHKPDIDGSEYAPLAELPNLREITIHGTYKNGSLLTMFEAIKSWQRAETDPLTVHFTDELPPVSNITMARMNSMHSLSHSLKHRPDRIELRASYNFFEISRDSRPLEQSLATIALIAASFEINWLWRRVTLRRCPKSDISDLIPLLKSYNIKGLTIEFAYENIKETSMPKLIGSMIPDGEFFLKSIEINLPEIDRFGTLQLVRLKSITFLDCSFSDWESVDLLNELTNLQTLSIFVNKGFEKSSSKALCNLLNTCKVFANILCHHWVIEFNKIDTILSSSNGTNTLKILNTFESRFLNELFEALANRTFEANEELDISCLHYLDFKDILKVAEIHTLKKLRMSLLDINGIEKLSELTELEELTIWNDKGGSLIELFIQLAAMESPKLRVLRLKSARLSTEDIFNVSKIKSLRNLEFVGPVSENCASVTELANSNIEELTITGRVFFLHKLLAAFAAKTSTKLHHLEIESRNLDVVELSELSELKELRNLHFCDMDSTNLSFLRNLKHIESLTLSLDNVDGLHILADMGSLKELIIKTAHGSLNRVYKAFASKSDLKLEHLSVPIECVEELQQITRIKRLKKLHLCFIREVEFVSDLGQLTELESLRIETKRAREIEPVLAFLESCKNLDSFSIECTFDKDKNIIRKVHTLLKSIRNPALQRPLILTVILIIYSELTPLYLLEYLDDEHLKVFYSFKHKCRYYFFRNYVRVICNK